MIIGAHVVIASEDPEADHSFFRDVLGINAVDAGEGYLIFGLPPSEFSVHASSGPVPQHELHLLCDDAAVFAAQMKDSGIECGDVTNTGWGLLVSLKLPSGAPLSVYQPLHERPSDPAIPAADHI
jgi:hypothetical protein